MSKSKTKPMGLTHLHLENWRNFLKVDARLQSRVFLVGPNASGKSNFLDAFRFLHDIVSVGGGFQQAVIRRGGVSSLRCLAARQYSDICVEVQLGADPDNPDWKYEIHFNQDKLRRPLVKQERVMKKGVNILNRPDENDRQDPERLTQTYLEQVQANQEFREVANVFAAMRYLHIVPQLVREPDRSVGRKNDPYGGDFLEQIACTQERTRNAWLRRIRDALKVAVPQLQDLELARDPRGTPHLRGKYEHWRPQGAWQSEEQFSDGTLRLMGLLWATLEGNGPLLLEEPELSLHPEVVRFIPQMFTRIQRRTGRQILISTHSPEMLRDEGIGLDQVLLLVPQAEGTSVKPATALQDAQTLLDSGLSLAEVVLPHTAPEKAHQLSLFGESWQ
jgi:predicted ATPase